MVDPFPCPSGRPLFSQLRLFNPHLALLDLQLTLAYFDLLRRPRSSVHIQAFAQKRTPFRNPFNSFYRHLWRETVDFRREPNHLVDHLMIWRVDA